MPTQDSGQPNASTIGESHIDHETALSMAKSIRRAEVALLGDDTDGISTKLQAELSRAHATLVSKPTPATKFVIPTPTATEDEILAAAEQGALLVQASDVAALVHAYQAVWMPDSLQEAARRAREDARKLALMKAFSVKVSSDKWHSELTSSRMARSRSRNGDDTIDSGLVDRERLRSSHLSEAERRVDSHARSNRR
jgi:hypothetical protein